MAATLHSKVNQEKLSRLNIIDICEQILNLSVPMARRLSGILMGGVVIVYERKLKLLYEDVTRLMVQINEAWKVKARLAAKLVDFQFDAENITLPDHFESHYTDMFNHFERYHDEQLQGSVFKTFTSYLSKFIWFDIEGDKETQMNFTQPEDAQIPSTPVPSPPKEQAHHQPAEIPDRQPEDLEKQQSVEAEEAFEQMQDQQRPKPARRRARKAVARVMEVAPIALLKGLFTNGNKEVHYPAPLLKLWMRSTQPPHDSPSGKPSLPYPPEPSYSSSGENMGNLEPVRYLFEDFQGGVGSPSVGISIEKQRENLNNNMIPPEILMEDLRTNPANVGLHPTEANRVKKTDHMATPGSGDEPRSIPSSGSGHGLLSQNSVTNSNRSNKKRLHSSPKNNGNGLQPVAEENTWHNPTPNFKLTRLSELSENGFTQDKVLATLDYIKVEQELLYLNILYSKGVKM
ncbi:unnamed protein product [Withania somnifera]